MVESCTDYRESQQLLALRKRLSENRLTPKEREELIKLIRELEQKLKLA
jgi:hypothetical protein